MDGYNSYSISIAKSRNDKQLQTCNIFFDDLLKKISNPIKTQETFSEYSNMSDNMRNLIKDVGGFVGGVTSDGSRKKAAIESRSMITLDADHATTDLIKDFKNKCPWLSCFYSTHSHSDNKPRLRIVIPLSRNVSASEYEQISEHAARMIGINYFDECSFRVNQLMYWPSVSCDGQYVSGYNDAEKFDVDAVIKSISELAENNNLLTKPESITKCNDPLSKDGIIGEFNNRYFPISKALDELIPGTYICYSPDRYRYHESNSVAGVQVYEDKFIYSYHDKDPAKGNLWSAFDIVRIHKLGINATCEDMIKYIRDNKLLDSYGSQSKSQASDSKNNDSEPEWFKHLELKKNGEIANRPTNVKVILENDVKLKGFRHNVFSDDIEITDSLPWTKKLKPHWTDSDDSQLICYLDKNYGRFSENNVINAFKAVADNRSYHPVINYLENLSPWDGVPRIETLLIDYLGAEDNFYTREVSKLILMAAIRRILQPGIKFDYVVVLCGDQGIGKSTLISKLGMNWYSDSLTISDMNDKTAAEKLAGNWIIEISELAGIRKADMDKVKGFITRTEDKYRKAYGRNTTAHKRECVFFGTTNEVDGYLRDVTGNRRYLSIKVSGESKYKPWNLDQETIDQIWAETFYIAKDMSYPLTLTEEGVKFAKIAQQEAMEQDEWRGVIELYLDMGLPRNWYDMTSIERRIHFQKYLAQPEQCSWDFRREVVSNVEIWCECLNRNQEDMKSPDVYRIKKIMESLPNWRRSNSKRTYKAYGKQRVYERI